MLFFRLLLSDSGFVRVRPSRLLARDTRRSGHRARRFAILRVPSQFAIEHSDFSVDFLAPFFKVAIRLLVHGHTPLERLVEILRTRRLKLFPRNCRIEQVMLELRRDNIGMILLEPGVQRVSKSSVGDQFLLFRGFDV